MARKKKEWMAAAVKKPGTFTAWCKKQGYKSTTWECIRKGMKSRSLLIRRRAQLAARFHEQARKLKKKRGKARAKVRRGPPRKKKR